MTCPTMMRFFLPLIITIQTATAIANDGLEAQRQAAIQAAAVRGEAFWRQVSQDQMRPNSGCRPLLGYALTLCEARQHPERLERLLAVTRQMQDQDPRSKNWGNLRWYWRDAAVTDTNAVEFCMHDALLLRIRHGDWLPEKAGKELDALLGLGVEGCLRHRVPTDYTNIALLNAGNLIVLGERLRRPDAAQEGYRRLDAVCALTAAFGLHEFCSPTYYDTDLNGLLLIHTYAHGGRQREQADALLQLVWTDIAANWFPAAQRLGGCHSRSYDYLHGLGGLDWHFWVHGWLESASPGSAERCEPWADQWLPPRQLADMRAPPRSGGRRQFPRLVRQHWGMLPAESRTHMLYPDISLSCCGASYGNQDAALTVDLPGPRDMPRCYFIPDGREDPYGKVKYETGAARHLKALHLQPFWAGAQRSCDALGLVIYRSGDLKGAEVTHVQSQFVLRRPDEIWLDGRRLTLPKGTAVKPAEVPFRSRASLVLRYGGAAVGLRVPWSVALDGQAATAKLVDDGNSWNCLRVTVDHGVPAKLSAGTMYSWSVANDMAAGAALWVRVGNGLAGEADFAAWRRAFETAPQGVVRIGESEIHCEIGGKEGPLSVTADAPWDASGQVRIVPPPYQGVLEIDGREVGRPLLTAVEPLCSCPRDAGPLHCIAVSGGKPVYWEAESGLVLPGMEVIEDASASGHRCVGQEHSLTGQPSGVVLWSLAVEKPGRYWLWARVRSADAKHGTFSIRVIGGDGTIVPPSTWLLRSAGKWAWKPLEFPEYVGTMPLDLPKGVCRIELQTRQSGTRIDRLMLTDDPDLEPK